MRESDSSILNGLAGESDNVSNNNDIDLQVLPDQFKTVNGKTVKLVGTQHSCSLALISYSTSKIQGNALLNEAIENPNALLSEVDLMYDEDFLEDDNGDENDSLILPIDAIDLSSDLRGIVIDCDLRMYINGFEWLLKPIFLVSNIHLDKFDMTKHFTLSGALKSIISFIKVMQHLSEKTYFFKKLDGHQLFFNVEYGTFRFIYDGVDVVHADDLTENERLVLSDNFNNCVSAIIIHSLIGWWPHFAYRSLLEFPEKNDELKPDDYSDPSDEEHYAFAALGLLPSGLKQIIVDSCINGGITLDQWEKELNEAVNSIEKCLFCEAELFKAAKQCWNCEKQTDKSTLLTKWSVQMKDQEGIFKISFGRGFLIPGEFLGLSTQFTPYMKIMYNPKNNSLGVKNLSGIKWIITKSEIPEDLLPGAIMPIDKEMSIEFEGYPGIIMHFIGYDC